jgi:hypothetical protein
MTVVSGVTVVPNARIAGVALTGFHGYKAVAAMGKTLELDGGKRVLRKQEVGRAHKSDKPLFHTFPIQLPKISGRPCVVLVAFFQFPIVARSSKNCGERDDDQSDNAQGKSDTKRSPFLKFNQFHQYKQAMRLL